MLKPTKIKGASANVLDVIGNTPVVKLNRIGQECKSQLLAKLEFMNPGGSIKDRIGLHIVESAEKEGLIKPGGTIIEATSGNTGVGLAIASALKGYKCIFVMPDKMSKEKIQNLRAFGAKVVVTPTAVEPDDPRSYYMVAERLVKETPNSFYANQYHNPRNPETHYQWTGPEIWEQLGEDLDTLVIGMGTGGTISGCGKFLKEKNPKIKIIGVDPIGSLYHEYFTTGKLGEAHTYLTEGIGEDFLPSTMDFSVVDEVVQVTDKESMNMTRTLLKKEGLYAGPSSGAAVFGALKYARALKTKENILVILPDSGNRYLSKVFNDDWMQENSMLDESDGIIENILTYKHFPEVISIRQDETADNVIRKMKTYGISQFPVTQDKKLVGILKEIDLIQPLFEGKIKGDDPIAPLVRKNVWQLSPKDSLEKLAEILESGHTCVVVNEEKIVGILTSIDLIAFLSEQKKISNSN